MLGIIIAMIGVALLVYGTLITFGFIRTDNTKDSDIDKKLLSEKSRYFLGRYNAGIQLMVAGIAAIALGLIMYLAA